MQNRQRCGVESIIVSVRGFGLSKVRELGRQMCEGLKFAGIRCVRLLQCKMDKGVES
jgi:hypothetical protein